MAISILAPLDKAYKITTTFYDKVILGPRTGQQHNALDYSTPVGTPIYAGADSKVTRADAKDIWGGNIIQLDNSSTGLTEIFAHLSKFNVTPGQNVHAGDLVGWTGNTGEATTGPHLYFETRINGKPVDPQTIIKGSPMAGGGTVDNTSTIIKWLTGYFASPANKADIGHRTWGDYFNGVNAAWIGAPVNPNAGLQAVQDLGLSNSVIKTSDFSKVASKINEINQTPQQDNGLLGIPGAIRDAAFTLGLILLGAALLIGAFFLLRSSRE